MKPLILLSLLISGCANASLERKRAELYDKYTKSYSYKPEFEQLKHSLQNYLLTKRKDNQLYFKRPKLQDLLRHGAAHKGRLFHGHASMQIASKGSVTLPKENLEAPAFYTLEEKKGSLFTVWDGTAIYRLKNDGSGRTLHVLSTHTAPLLKKKKINFFIGPKGEQSQSSPGKLAKAVDLDDILTKNQRDNYKEFALLGILDPEGSEELWVKVEKELDNGN